MYPTARSEVQAAAAAAEGKKYPAHQNRIATFAIVARIASVASSGGQADLQADESNPRFNPATPGRNNASKSNTFSAADFSRFFLFSARNRTLPRHGPGNQFPVNIQTKSKKVIPHHPKPTHLEPMPLYDGREKRRVGKLAQHCILRTCLPTHPIPRRRVRTDALTVFRTVVR